MDPSPPPPPGAGGKFRKPPVSRKRRPSTPYDRPSINNNNNNNNNNNKSNESQDDGGSWLSKLVVNPARRLIATRILPSFFSTSESFSADEEDEFDSSDEEDVDETVNALGDAKPSLEVAVPSSSRDAGPSNERDKLKGSSDSENANVQQDKSIGDFDQIENLLKGKQLTWDEGNRLMEILKSRLVDDSNAEGEKKADKVDELDREIPSMGKQYDVETPMPRLQSNIQDEVAASPIDIAKAYMGSRTSELGFNTYSNSSTGRREHEHSNLFPSKPHFITPLSKSSTCWPGAMVQDHRAYMTPQNQRSRYGLHNFPRTPYTRNKPKLNQLQGNIRSSNISMTTLQQSRTPNPWQMKTSSDVTDGGYGSVGPIRRIRNKLASEPYSEGPRSLSSAQIASSSNASRSFVPVFQKKPITAVTPNLHTADKHEQTFKNDASSSAQIASPSNASRSFVPVFQKKPVTAVTPNLHAADKREQTFKNDANSAGLSNETVKKILEQLDRHKPTPKEKAAELKLATEWKRSPSQHTNSIMPNIATVTGPNLQGSGVLSENRSFSKGTDVRVSFEDPKETSNAATKTFTSVNDAGAGPSFGFKNMGVANEKSTVTNIKENEKSQPWSFDNQINGQDLTRKRPSQSILKPISFQRPDPQQVISSDNGPGFTFAFTASASSASEPPTPSIMPTFQPTAAAPTSKELPAVPTYSFGTKKSSERVVFSFPSMSSAPVDDGASHLKFNFGSDKKRVCFGSIGSDAIVIT